MSVDKKEMIETFRGEVMERDALNRIKWDKRLNPRDFCIHYVDRGPDRWVRLVKVNFKDVEINGDFMLIGDRTVPMHRIRKITYREKTTVWEKRRIEGG